MGDVRTRTARLQRLVGRGWDHGRRQGSGSHHRASSKAGKTAGLNTLGLVTQRQFLENLNLSSLRKRLKEHAMTPRTIQANRAGLTDLVRPGGLGDFKVLIQSKNVGRPVLWGLKASPQATDLVDDLPVPLLTDHHISLPSGQLTESYTDFEAYWPFTDQEPPEATGEAPTS